MANASSKSWLSMSTMASVITTLYIGMAFLNMYRLMYPLTFRDLSSFPESQFVGPLWDEASQMHMKVYISSREQFDLDFLRSDFPDEGTEQANGASSNVNLLWEEDLTSASLTKSFLLTSLDCDETTCQKDASYAYATAWLDETDHMALEEVDGGLVSALLASAGEGIESTSILLTLYVSITNQIKRLFSLTGLLSTDSDSETKETAVSKTNVVKLSRTSPLWSALRSNRTLHAHVVLTKTGLTGHGSTTPATYEDAARSLIRAQKSHSLLLGQVDMIKYDAPHHIEPPRRLLYRDLAYVWKRYVLHSIDETARPPWDMAYAKPEEYETYQQAKKMKAGGAGYPYWKPEVSIKYVNENLRYPIDYAGMSGMELVRLGGRSQSHPTGVVFLPAMHVDEIGLTSEKYIPVNGTITSLPLRMSFDRSDMVNEQRRTTATAGGISPARWRLLNHLSSSIESQKELGFEQSDIDDLRRLIADTNVTLLAITVLASALHLLFEFLTFKNDVSFWRSNKDLTGLSVRSLFLDMFSQVIILLYLIEQDSSLLMTIPTGIGCLIALWKCQRGAGFKFVRVGKGTNSQQRVRWWNILPRLVGYELHATRLEIASTQPAKDCSTADGTTSTDLTALTIETDRIATRTLGSLLLPVVIAYTLYSFLQEEHTGWYSWLITCSSSAVYALGFVLMTPQLFLNYKLKSVAHLPWRVLGYRFINTFIDDLFAFIIRMPTMARISCFRDDIVFIVYLYQRWLYPVDTSRPVEGGDGPTSDTSIAKKNQ